MCRGSVLAVHFGAEPGGYPPTRGSGSRSHSELALSQIWSWNGAGTEQLHPRAGSSPHPQHLGGTQPGSAPPSAQRLPSASRRGPQPVPELSPGVSWPQGFLASLQRAPQPSWGPSWLLPGLAVPGLFCSGVLQINLRDESAPLGPQQDRNRRGGGVEEKGRGEAAGTLLGAKKVKASPEPLAPLPHLFCPWPETRASEGGGN